MAAQRTILFLWNSNGWGFHTFSKIGINESKSFSPENRGETAAGDSPPVVSNSQTVLNSYFFDDNEEENAVADAEQQETGAGIILHLLSLYCRLKDFLGDIFRRKSKHSGFIKKLKHVGKDIIGENGGTESHEKVFRFHLKTKKYKDSLIEWNDQEEHRRGGTVQRPPGLENPLRVRRPSVSQMKAKVRESSGKLSFGYGVDGPSPPSPPPLVTDRTAADDLIDESSKDDFCPTCLEPYDTENPKITAKCGHSYHLACIYEWLERSSYCPICAAKMEFGEETLNAIPEDEER
eukprot:jgi/Galph1/2317/GphlegSOOS_G988.1